MNKASYWDVGMWGSLVICNIQFEAGHDVRGWLWIAWAAAHLYMSYRESKNHEM